MSARDSSSVGQLLRNMIASGQISDPASPRGRLLAAAAKLFRAKGYSRTTVRDLAAEVGILSGSIFHHFNNKDEILDHDPESVIDGYFGINIHRSSTRAAGSTDVDRWSAGCQVFAKPGANGFAEFMDLCKKSRDMWGPKFSYTLVDEPEM